MQAGSVSNTRTSMQAGSMKRKPRSAIAGLLLSALVATGCAVEDPADAQDDPLAAPTETTEIQEAANLSPTAEIPGLRSTTQLSPQSSLESARSGVTANACRTTCRDVVHPELCLVIPFPFCLIPQHDCVTLCDAP